MSRFAQTLVVWLVLVVGFVAAYMYLRPPAEHHPEVEMLTVFEQAKAEQIAAARFTDDSVVVTYRDGTIVQAPFKRYRRGDVKTFLRAHDIEVEGDDEGGFFSGGWTLPVVLLAALLLVVLVVYRLRQSGFGVLSMRQTNAKLLAAPPKVTFDDVGGNDEAKQRLRDVVGFFRDPERWRVTGARPPHGILLEGPPGLGKTLLARALAGEAKVPFFTATGSDFIELFVGVGAARVRDLFEKAQQKAPSIIFIDELDAIGRRRGSASHALVHQEREQALNQLLTMMDGFAPLDRVVMVAATNRADVLDPALLRPGRFDVRVTMAPLTLEGRRAVLTIHARGKRLDGSVDLAAVAAKTEGASGAALEHLLNEAALLAARAGKSAISAADVEAAMRAQPSAVAFDALDAVLVDGAQQFSRPALPVFVSLDVSGRSLEGEVIWVDPHAVKLLQADGKTEVVLRRHITALRARPGTPAGEAGAAVPTEVGVA